MERRTLLKAMLALPVIYKGVEVGKAIEVSPEKTYVVFINGALVDVDDFCCSQDPLPVLREGTPVHVVYPHGDHTLDDAIRIYEVGK